MMKGIRIYARDSRGRFSSQGSSSVKATRKLDKDEAMLKAGARGLRSLENSYKARAASATTNAERQKAIQKAVGVKGLRKDLTEAVQSRDYEQGRGLREMGWEHQSEKRHKLSARNDRTSTLASKSNSADRWQSQGASQARKTLDGVVARFESKLKRKK